MLYLVFFGACWQTFRRFYVGDDFPPHFYRQTPAQRLLVLSTYGGLIVVCGCGMAYSQMLLRSPERLARESRSIETAL